MAWASRPRTATGSPSPMSPPARRAPAWGLAIVKRILEGARRRADPHRRRRPARGPWPSCASRAGGAALQSDPNSVFRRPPREIHGRRHPRRPTDEADIRDLVAGILEDEGYSVRTALDFRRRPGRHPRPPAVAADPGHLDAGAGGWTGWSCSTWSRPWTRRCRLVMILRPWQHRDRGFRPSSAAPTTSWRSRSSPTGCCCWSSAPWRPPPCARENRRLAGPRPSPRTA